MLFEFRRQFAIAVGPERGQSAHRRVARALGSAPASSACPASFRKWVLSYIDTVGEVLSRRLDLSLLVLTRESWRLLASIRLVMPASPVSSLRASSPCGDWILISHCSPQRGQRDPPLDVHRGRREVALKSDFHQSAVARPAEAVIRTSSESFPSIGGRSFIVAVKAAARLNASAAQSSSWVSLIPTLQQPSLAAVQPRRRGQAPHMGSGKWNIRRRLGGVGDSLLDRYPCGHVRVFWARS